ncbi:MAG: hypothetical protein QOI95_1117 [Acidimicrobiaceae bacterium]|jgi:tetratricopeptide (TPR) repeat protein
MCVDTKRVFISHSSVDHSLAHEVCAQIEVDTAPCWIAPRDVTPGRDYASDILHAIEAAGIFVVLLTKSSIESPQVVREVERAASNRVALLPVRLDDTPLTPSLEYFLSSSHWVSPTGDQSATAAQVRDAVRRCLGIDNAPSTTPPDVSPPLPIARLDHRLSRITRVAGRTKELASLCSLLPAVTSDHNSTHVGFVLIGGESGVGKSALVSATASAAFDQGWDIASVACEPFHEGMSFFPIRELMRQISGTGDVVAAVQALYGVGSSQAAYAIAAEDPSTPSEQRREALIATASNLVFGQRRASSSPALLLVLDDLERIDPGSVDALLCLLSRSNESPVLVVGLYRTDFVERVGRQHPIMPLIDAVRRMPDVAEEVRLGALMRGDLPQLVEMLAGGSCDFPSAFFDHLYEETEGNPLYVREVFRSLQQPPRGSDPVVAIVDDRWRIVDPSREWEIPQSIEEAVVARLEVLDAVQREQLETAAVIGRRFAFEVMAKLVEASESELVANLEKFINFDLLNELPGSEELFEFTHGKIRDVLYNAMSRLRRRRLHGRVADVLKDSRAAMSEDWDALLAEHLFRAGRMAEALPLLRTSAAGLLRLHAGHEAATQLRRVLEADSQADLLGATDRIAVQLELVTALKLANEYEAAASLVDFVVDSPHADRVSKGWALDHLGDIHWTRGQVQEAKEVYASARQLAEEANDAALLLEVFADLTELHDREAERVAGTNPQQSTEHRQLSERYLDEQLRLSEVVPDNQARARALRNEAKRRRRKRQIDAALALYEEAISLSDPRVATHQVLISYAKTLRYAGRHEDACRVVDRVLDWSQQTGARRSLAIALHYRGMLEMEAVPADLVGAARDLQDAVALHEDIGYLRGRCETATSLGELALALGDRQSMMRWFREACAGGDDLSDDAIVNAVVATLEASDETKRARSIRDRLKSA